MIVVFLHDCNLLITDSCVYVGLSITVMYVLLYVLSSCLGPGNFSLSLLHSVKCAVEREK